MINFLTVATAEMGRDPIGVLVFGGEMRSFAQLSHFENLMRKILKSGVIGI